MATTTTGLTTTRWTLALDENGLDDQSVSDWLALHTEPSFVLVPQTITCMDEVLSLSLSIPQGPGMDPLSAAASVPLVSDPPVPVVCWHRWMADDPYLSGEGRRTCLECGQVQVMDWVDVG